MKLYNQLSRRVEKFTPLSKDEVRVYTCGPTVYDHAHIGNLSTYIFADTLHRTLSLAGYKVNRAMNYTDVDDKTIRRSRELYPSEEAHAALSTLTTRYIALFLQDMRAIGNDISSLSFLRATDTIEEMKQLIASLHTKGFAYLADDGVYFSIQAYRDSGKTYGQLLEITASNTSEARIQNDEYDKDSVHDFALWKKQKAGEPAWEFTLEGQDLTGRPGWHIECSAMSHKALKKPFDIHTGGVDNIFPHHENEIAQSTAGEDDPRMAQAFVHAAHILVDGKKMAKSANNFHTLQDVIEKGFEPLAFRLLVLQGHYQSQVNFTWQSLEAAQNRLKNLRALAALRFQSIKVQRESYDFADAWQKVLAPMQDNLDTPKALAVLSDIEGKISERLISGQEKSEFQHFLHSLDELFGLELLAGSDISPAQQELLLARETARKAKDFARADKLRQQLLEAGLEVRDTSYGPIWSRR